MPRFEPFPALRYSTTTSTDVTALTSPPYDVFDEKERNQYAALNPHNIVRVDYPVESEGPELRDHGYFLPFQMSPGQSSD